MVVAATAAAVAELPGGDDAGAASLTTVAAVVCRSKISTVQNAFSGFLKELELTLKINALAT